MQCIYLRAGAVTCSKLVLGRLAKTREGHPAVRPGGTGPSGLRGEGLVANITSMGVHHGSASLPVSHNERLQSRPQTARLVASGLHHGGR